MLKKEVCPGISLLILSRRFSLYSVLSQTPHGPADGFRATISWTPADRRNTPVPLAVAEASVAISGPSFSWFSGSIEIIRQECRALAGSEL